MTEDITQAEAIEQLLNHFAFEIDNRNVKNAVYPDQEEIPDRFLVIYKGYELRVRIEPASEQE